MVPAPGDGRMVCVPRKSLWGGDSGPSVLRSLRRCDSRGEGWASSLCGCRFYDSGMRPDVPAGGLPALGALLRWVGVIRLGCV